MCGWSPRTVRVHITGELMQPGDNQVSGYWSGGLTTEIAVTEYIQDD